MFLNDICRLVNNTLTGSNNAPADLTASQRKAKPAAKGKERQTERASRRKRQFRYSSQGYLLPGKIKSAMSVDWLCI